MEWPDYLMHLRTKFCRLFEMLDYLSLSVKSLGSYYSTIYIRVDFLYFFTFYLLIS